MADSVVWVDHLAHTFLAGTSMSVAALRDASISVQAGQVHAIVGPGGAGKSTLAHFVSALVRPATASCVRLFGQDTGSNDTDMVSLRQRIGLVFQAPHVQLIERYVADDVALGPRQQGLDGDPLRERVRWAMDVVGLPLDAYGGRRTFELSGGEMQRARLLH